MGRNTPLNLFKRSLWVFHLNTGSCNACDIELLNIFAPVQDAERFGVKLVGSPRHADVIMLSGPITRESLPRVIRAFIAIPDPKVVIAIGSCACSGGIWYDSYNVIGGVECFYRILREKFRIEPPVTVYVPGCPPKPEAILYAIGLLRNILPVKQRRKVYVEDSKTAKKHLKMLEEESLATLKEYLSKHALTNTIKSKGGSSGYN